MKTALIVIDVQNYFVNENSQQLPQKIKKFIEKNSFDYVLFTQFINNKNSNYFKLLNWKQCVDSPEIDIHSELQQFVSKDNVFIKHTYSIFKSKKFVSFLKKRKVIEIFLCGIDTDACVLASAFEGFDLGYNVRVLTNLCQSHAGNIFHTNGIKIIKKNIQTT